MLNQKGLSLVELMIALLLGSILTLAATQLFLVNRQTDNLQTGISGVQDSGRFAFDYVSRALMEAGYSEDEPIVPFILDDSDFGYEITDGAPYDDLVFEVRAGKDCQGRELTGFKRFHVLDDADGKRLVCAAYRITEEEIDGETVSSWTAFDRGPLIDNIESFQILYGLDFDAPDQDGYGQADLYTNATRTKALEDDISKGSVRIVSVRFSVLLASDEVVTLHSEYAPDSLTVLDQTYQQGDGSGANQINFEDGRLYRTYGSTVAIRNLVSGL